MTKPRPIAAIAMLAAFAMAPPMSEVGPLGAAPSAELPLRVESVTVRVP